MDIYMWQLYMAIERKPKTYINTEVLTCFKFSGFQSDIIEACCWGFAANQSSVYTAVCAMLITDININFIIHFQAQWVMVSIVSISPSMSKDSFWFHVTFHGVFIPSGRTPRPAAAHGEPSSCSDLQVHSVARADHGESKGSKMI